MSRSFRIHLRIYCVFVAFFGLVWLVTGGGYFWPVWPTLGWGVAVASHWAATGGGRRRPAEEPTSTALPRPRRDAPPDRLSRPTPPPAPRRRWVTVMFTDIAGSTSLNEALGDDEWSRFLSSHRQMVRDALRDRGGTEVSTQGDGLLGRFASPADAVLCAVDIQRRIEDMRGSGGMVPRVRIGVHAGEAVDDEGDIVGRVVNLAARVTSEAQPGEILVTEPVADELAGRLELEDRGLRPLRGVPQPRHLLAVRWS